MYINFFLFFVATTESTGNCLRKWGMFQVGKSCGDFVNCVGGVEHQFKCPEGLAWHPKLWRCEWPDQVPTCNVEGIYLYVEQSIENRDLIAGFSIVT